MKSRLTARFAPLGRRLDRHAVLRRDRENLIERGSALRGLPRRIERVEHRFEPGTGCRDHKETGLAIARIAKGVTPSARAVEEAARANANGLGLVLELD